MRIIYCPAGTENTGEMTYYWGADTICTPPACSASSAILPIRNDFWERYKLSGRTYSLKTVSGRLIKTWNLDQRSRFMNLLHNINDSMNLFCPWCEFSLILWETIIFWRSHFGQICTIWITQKNTAIRRKVRESWWKHLLSMKNERMNLNEWINKS